ncbi:hypothetical protein AXG93_523s1120 [Marchantia polymorpha subsp. ruderalis]|uniref:Uncharacterized protein n=1 Tax=Marchantia polymorpha subsp. ruderalis TaxID=1480154 RepID=A0A176VW21_MARPO|nr:hypothetical protein AXG93_523s1120 [Marchantia polymorpha subsp. ruderalis]
MLTNEVNSDIEGEPRDLPQQRRKRSLVRQDSQPRKKRRIDGAAVAEERLRQAALVKMRSPYFWARTKMKAMRLILEEDSNTESRRVAVRGRHVKEAGPVAIAAKEKEKSMEKKPRYTEERRTHVKPQRASTKDKGKAVWTKEVPLRQNEKVAAKAVEDVATVESGPQKLISTKYSTETVNLETSEEPSAEETQSSVFGATDVLCVQVLPLLQYLNRKRKKYANARTNESYVDIMRN